MNPNRFSRFLRSYALALTALALILTACSSTATATTSPPSDFTGRLSGPTNAHPTPLRIYLVTAETSPTGHRHTGYFTVTRSNGSVWRLPTCRYEDSDNCVWPARWTGNRRGRSFVTINGRTRYFPSAMLGVVLR